MLDAEVSSVRMLWVGLSGSLDASSWELLHGVQRLADTLHALDREMLMVSALPTAPG